MLCLTKVIVIALSPVTYLPQPGRLLEQLREPVWYPHYKPAIAWPGVTGGCAGSLETHSTHATESRVPTTVVTPTAWRTTNIICATLVSDPARTPGALANRYAWRQLSTSAGGFDKLSLNLGEEGSSARTKARRATQPDRGTKTRSTPPSRASNLPCTGSPIDKATSPRQRPSARTPSSRSIVTSAYGNSAAKEG